jgi:hypothetical protein
MTPNDNKPRRRPRDWPGMPSRRSKLFEFFVGIFPDWIAIVGFSLALTFLLVQSCRNSILN